MSCCSNPLRNEAPVHRCGGNVGLRLGGGEAPSAVRSPHVWFSALPGLRRVVRDLEVRHGVGFGCVLLASVRCARRRKVQRTPRTQAACSGGVLCLNRKATTLASISPSVNVDKGAIEVLVRRTMDELLALSPHERSAGVAVRIGREHWAKSGRHLEKLLEIYVSEGYARSRALSLLAHVFRNSILEACGHSWRASNPAWPRSYAVEDTRGVTIVKTVPHARRVVEMLRREDMRPDRIHAIDTEVRGWEQWMSPYKRGEIICFSIYCGEDVNFGSGPRLFVDNFDGTSTNLQEGILSVFKPYLEDENVKKVFHNYAFDRAMFSNHGIDIKGFAADTMHMAHLCMPYRHSFTLQALCGDLLGKKWAKDNLSDLARDNYVEMSDLSRLQQSQSGARNQWIEYSTFDTVATWKLHQYLAHVLSLEHCGSPRAANLLDAYNKFWRPCAEVLVKMEQRGIPCDVAYLDKQRIEAQIQFKETERAFRAWLAKVYAQHYSYLTLATQAAQRFVVTSAAHLNQLLYGRCVREVEGVLVCGLGLDPPWSPNGKDGSEDGLSVVALNELMRKYPKFEPGLRLIVKGQEISGTTLHYLDLLSQSVDEGRIYSSISLCPGRDMVRNRKPNLYDVFEHVSDPLSIRAAIRCKPQKRLIIASYRDLEFKVLAHFTRCPLMAKACDNCDSIYSFLAIPLFPEVKMQMQTKTQQPTIKRQRVTRECREKGRTIFFAALRGTSPFDLAEELGCTRALAEKCLRRWHARFPVFNTWKERTLEEVLTSFRRGALTLQGRRIPTTSTLLDVVQDTILGSTIEIVLEGLVQLDSCEQLKLLGYDMIFVMNNTLVLEGPEETYQSATDVVRRLLEAPCLDEYDIKVPLCPDVTSGEQWSEGLEA